MEKILFISLGCDKNLVDSEVMLGMLSDKGYELTDDGEQADVAVINTCCFINDAKEESIETILDTARLKSEGRLKALVVTGCLAQRYREEIRTQIPEVDAVVGTTAIDSLVEAVEQVLSGKRGEYYEDLGRSPGKAARRLITTGGHYSYLKIAEGCDKRCTYCVIPKVRGPYRSVPMERLVEEARQLAEEGVKELILVAQETTVYGTDLYGEKRLPELLRSLCAVEGIRWIRLLYCYPEEVTEELIDTIRSEEKLCHYLDLPVQHASDRILRRMGRRTDSGQIRQIIRRLREKIPDICIRTTLITGFPGETEEDHRALKEFVAEMKFDRLGVFTYSREEDTPAAAMPEQVHGNVKKRRRRELMELQREIAYQAAGEMKGRRLPVMVEGALSGENAYVARTYKDAPGVDGYLFIDTERELMTGDLVEVRVTGSHEYDLLGELI